MKQRGNIYIYLIAAVAVSTVLAGTHWKAYLGGKAQVQLEWDKDKAQRTAAALAADQAARAKEQQLQAEAAKQRSVANAKIQTLNATLADSLERLRNRPERPSGGDLPQPAGAIAAAPSCTGAQLFRGDAEFLGRFAADADRLRIALAACQSQYETARAVK